MNFSHLLFSFDGRISRKTYILALIALMLVMCALYLLGALLMTGDPFSYVFWGFPREKIGLWGSFYGGIALVLLWPTIALFTKRLHDRGYPMWVGLAIYAVMIAVSAALYVFGLMPSPETNSGKLPLATALIISLVTMPAGIWLSAQTMFMRGVVGTNAYGPDPLAGHPLPGYEPRTFWNVVFNPDGRMNRKTWWLMFVSLVVLFIILGVTYGTLIMAAVSRLPQSADPAWASSVEGRQAIVSAILPAVIPVTLAFYLLLWPALAAGAKRLHDQGRSGWLLASYFVPLALIVIAGSLLPAPESGEPPAGPALWLMIAAGVTFAGLTLWLFVVLGFLKGQPTENAYGPPTASRA